MSNLTYQFINTINKPGRYFDSGTNLHLLVRNGSNGPKKYWIFRFTYEGKRRDKSLGSYPAVSLSSARELAISARVELNKGTLLPRDDSKVAKNTQSFHEFTLDWIEMNKGQRSVIIVPPQLFCSSSPRV